MAWTADGTRFKYSRRVGSRVVTSYFPGPFGAEVAERIAERRGQREKLKEIRAEDRRLNAPLAAVQCAIGTMAMASLYAWGFHQHKGQWREQRHGSIS